MTKFRRRVVAVLTAAVVGLGAAAPAGAQDFGSSAGSLGSSADSAFGDLDAQLSDLSSQIESDALNSRGQVAETVHNSFDAAVAAQMITTYDQIFDLVFPGLIARDAAEATRVAQQKAAEERAVREAEAAAERARQAEADRRNPANSPCPPQADACVDLAGSRSWLQENGEITYGPVQVGIGRPGYETPPGTFYVNRKVKDEISWEFNNAPMPYATYFTYNGIAFHQGDPNILSHGCVRMWRADAQKYFAELEIGDMVYVY